MVKKKTKGAKYIEYFQPVLDALRSLGLSATTKEVYGWILDNHGVPKSMIGGTTKGGAVQI